jgi:OFA family oxalate/formate antiporter-like MFS transporter
MALSAVGVHLPIGSVYAYSVLVLPLYDLHGWSRGEIMTAFSLTMLLMVLSTIFLGPKIERMGPRRAARLAACLYSLGIFIAGLGIKIGSLPLFIFGYGAVSGVGLGVGYITPVATLVKWFPDRRGLATGMAVMGFGFGALVFGPLMVKMMTVMPIWQTLCFLALVYGAMIFVASCYLETPPPGWQPAGYTPPASAAAAASDGVPTWEKIRAAVGTRRFICLWTMMFINVGCGLSVIAKASPMAQEVAGMTAIQAAGLVGIMGLFNGVGRFFWSSISDFFGRAQIFTTFFLLQAVAFFALTLTDSPVVFQILVLVIVSCYGGGFALLPAFLTDMFGADRLGSILGYALAAWGLAGISGPILLTMIVAGSSSYLPAFYLFAACMTLGLCVSLYLLLHLRRLEKTTS